MGGDTVEDKDDKKEKNAEGEGKEGKIKDKKKDKDKGDKEEKKKKKKSPEDKNNPAALKQKLEKIDAKMQAMTAKREQILKQIHEAEQGGAPAAVPPEGPHV